MTQGYESSHKDESLKVTNGLCRGDFAGEDF